MITNDLDQRSSFSKETELKEEDGWLAIDMDRLSSRLAKNIIGAVQVDPMDAVKQPYPMTDLTADSKKLLQSVECDRRLDEKGSSEYNFLAEMVDRFPLAAITEHDSILMSDNDTKLASRYEISEHTTRFSVTFDHITVREYPRILGPNIIVSGGPSISIDWEYIEHPPLSVDDFESIRTVRRHRSELLLSKARREYIASRILAESDVTLADVVRKSRTSKQSKSVVSIKNRLKSILAPQRQ